MAGIPHQGRLLPAHLPASHFPPPLPSSLSPPLHPKLTQGGTLLSNLRTGRKRTATVGRASAIPGVGLARSRVLEGGRSLRSSAEAMVASAVWLRRHLPRGVERPRPSRDLGQVLFLSSVFPPTFWVAEPAPRGEGVSGLKQKLGPECRTRPRPRTEPRPLATGDGSGQAPRRGSDSPAGFSVTASETASCTPQGEGPSSPAKASGSGASCP